VAHDTSIELTAVCYEHANGRKALRFEDRDFYDRAVDTLVIGLSYTVKIEEEKERRSSAANRFLWGVVYRDIFDETGTPKEVTHAEMCERFLRKQVFYTDKATGLTVEKWIVGGSSGLTPKQFHKFVEEVILWAAEWLHLTIDNTTRDYRDYTAERAAVNREAKDAA
jgi:hypothetical protein